MSTFPMKGEGTVTDLDVGEVTALLRAWHAGDEDAYRRASAILCDELRRRASFCIRGRRDGSMLQTTALVHEAFMRLAPARDVDWQDRRPVPISRTRLEWIRCRVSLLP